MQAYLGPAVAPARYQVTDAVRDALEGAVAHPMSSIPDVAQPDGPGHWLVDLVAANAAAAAAGRSPTGSVTRATLDTADRMLFSDRSARPCGRFALFARLLP